MGNCKWVHLIATPYLDQSAETWNTPPPGDGRWRGALRRVREPETILVDHRVSTAT